MTSPPRPYRGQQYSPEDMLPFIEVPRGEEPVVLKELDIRVAVTGLLAETTQTLVLHNPNSRDIEGHVTVPLPDGASVCGYALDVDGEMRDGVVVPKQEARRILEAEERKGADPGLIEQVQGNLYRTRVYPIPARGSRRLRVTYVSDLTVDGNDAAHHLPLRHAQHLDRVTLRVEVIQAPVQPELSGGVGNLTLERWEDRHVAEATLGRGMPVDDLQVRLPNLPGQFTVIERTSDEETFFCVSSRLEEPKLQEASSWKPRRLGLVWDASGSRQVMPSELGLLAKVSCEWPDAPIDVMVFRDRVAEERSFGPGERNEFLEFLGEISYDGATNLATLDLSRASHPEVDAWLLFSDGMGTLNRGLPKIGDAPIFTITAQADCDSALLHQIAEQSGGAYLNLLRTSTDRAWLQVRDSHDRARVADAPGCRSLHLVEGGGRLTVLGRLSEAEGSVTLEGHGAHSDPFLLKGESASPGRSIARAWAGREAQAIAVRGDEFSDELIDLGRRFGLVTPGSSLLVLESLDQYLEYGIEPPATSPKMRAEYLDRQESDNRNREREEKEQIENVLELWQRRVRWWEKDFLAEYEAKKRPRLTQQGMRRERENLRDLRRAEQLAQDRLIHSLEPEGDSFAEINCLRTQSASLSDCVHAAPPGPDDLPVDFCLAADSLAPDAEALCSIEISEATGPKGPTINVQPWDPDTPYLQAMRNANAGQVYAAYIQIRDEYENSPSFFLDCGDFFLRREHTDLGVRVLSNLLEMGLDDPALMRAFAWRALQAGEEDLAIIVLTRVQRMRPDEPQSHRDLALALAQRWERMGDAGDAIRAMELLYDVVLRTWDRFPEIELIALMELNHLMDRAARADVAVPGRIDSRFRRLLDLDVRISMSWDADLTDVDLHVFEPDSGHAYYANNLTNMGGLVSKDFTQGYGPEEYVLHRALPGTYIIKAHYYGSHRQDVCGPCTVTVNVFTDYGRPEEKKQVLTLRLDQPSDQVTVGEITIDPKSEPFQAQDNGWRVLFSNLKPGMSVDEIVAIVGQPKEITGDGQLEMIYRPRSGVELHVLVCPHLTAVQQVSEGARLKLV